MLLGRAHRVPDGRDSDLGVLWAGPGCSGRAAKPSTKTVPKRKRWSTEEERQPGSPPGSHTLERRTLSGPWHEKGAEERNDDMQQEGTAQRDGREGALKLLLGRICCLVGLLLSAGGFVVAILGASVNLSAGAVGITLGVLGYFLGARRLGAASVVFGTAAIFFMAAASTGLIPGIAPLGHGYN